MCTCACHRKSQCRHIFVSSTINGATHANDAFTIIENPSGSADACNSVGNQVLLYPWFRVSACWVRS